MNFFKRKPQAPSAVDSHIAEQQTKRVNQAPRVRYQSAAVNRLSGGFTQGEISNNQSIIASLDNLRNRSREQYRDNGYARRFVFQLRNHVVGSKGFRMQCKALDPDGTLDFLASAAVEAGWSEWSKKHHCDMAGRLSFLDIQNAFIASVALDGEFLALHVTGPQAGEFGYGLHVLDPVCLDHTYRDEYQGRRIRAGIEMDQYGKPVAYWLRGVRGDGLDEQTTYRNIGERTRVPAQEVLHCFLPEFVQQWRGVPWMAASLGRLRMLAGYEDASVINARISASKMGFLTVTSPDGQGYQGDGQDAEGQIFESVEPGSFTTLPEGVHLETFDTKFPDTQFSEFVKSTLRGVASGLGVSYNALANDLEGVNFSSMRSGEINDREFYKSTQEWMMQSFLEPVFERWLTAALLTQKLTVNNRPLEPLREEKYRAVTWVPRRWQWVDPRSEASAHQIELHEGLRSRSELIKQGGRDPEEVMREIAEENALAERLGAEIPARKEIQPTQEPDDDRPED